MQRGVRGRIIPKGGHCFDLCTPFSPPPLAAFSLPPPLQEVARGGGRIVSPAHCGGRMVALHTPLDHLEGAGGSTGPASSMLTVESGPGVEMTWLGRISAETASRGPGRRISGVERPRKYLQASPASVHFARKFIRPLSFVMCTQVVHKRTKF